MEWHAKALLDHVVAGSPDLIGSYIPHIQLDTVYRRDLCTKRRWSPHKWDAIGRELGKLTDKRIIKRGGKRFACYLIPKP